MILAIDTSGGQCAVALADGGGRLRASAAERMARGHAERLFPMIEAALADAGVGHAALTRIAVCTGPGSFTGIRIGVAAARGLALGAGVPAIGVGRLEALALAASRAARFCWDVGDVRIVGAPAPSAAPQAADPVIAVAVAAPGGRYRQDFPASGPGAGLAGALAFDASDAPPPPGALAVGDGWGRHGAVCTDGLAPVWAVAKLAVDRAPGPPPAPLYLRPPNADPPREAPPPMLD